MTINETQNLIEYHRIKNLIDKDYLSTHLKQLNINQTQFGNILGVDNKYINKILRGKIGLSSGRKLSIFYIIRDLYNSQNLKLKSNN